MKNLLKIIASVVLFVFASCEQESLENFDGSTKNQRTIKKVTYEEMSKNQKLLDKLSSVNNKYNILYNNAKLVAASDGSFYIDTNLATYVEESNGYHSYTFQIFRNNTAFYLENLVLNYSVIDSAYSVYLIQYDINEQEYQDIISGVADNNLKSKIFLTQLDDNVINISTILSKNGSTSYCPNCGCASFYDGYIFNGINDDGSIDWLEHICPGSGGSGGTTSSSGSSESPTVGSGYVPGYGIGVTPTAGSVNTNGLLGGGNNTPNTKPIVTVPTNLASTDGANATVSYLVNLLYLNNVQTTWLNHNTQVADQILNFLSQNNSSQESKEFVIWAINYMQQNPSVTWTQFQNWFMGESEGSDGEYDATYWDNPNLTFPQQSIPSWINFYNAYPKNTLNNFEMEAPAVYELIGGKPLEFRQAVLNDNNPNNDDLYNNACALRVSRALNYSGVTIPYIPNITFLGGDQKYYFLGAANLYKWMLKTFPLDSNSNYTTIQVDGVNGGTNGSLFPMLLDNDTNHSNNSNHGIYIMIPNVSSPDGFDATGHAGIYNTPELTHYYFNASGGVKTATLWILN